MISLAQLIAAGVGPSNARLFVDPLNESMARYGIATPKRAAAFVGQLMVESARFTRLEENLLYTSAERIMAVFGRRFDSLDDAAGYVRKPVALANRVYANRLGNGNVTSGDGWRYRGRGLIQLTGRDNYLAADSAIMMPLLDNPDLLIQPRAACLSAGWFWFDRGCNALADGARIDEITRVINGKAMMHAEERRQQFVQALDAFA